MIARYQVLARRVHLELEELERTQAAIWKHWQIAIRTANDQDAYLNSVALNLHSFYSGLERIFELIALELDGGALGGEAWRASAGHRRQTGRVPQVQASHSEHLRHQPGPRPDGTSCHRSCDVLASASR